MIQTLLTTQEGRAFTWIDIEAPTLDELKEHAKRFNLHPTSIQDCLDPLHLSKFEEQDSATFIILRVYDETARSEKDSIRSVTKKVALFMGSDFLLTVHRSGHPYLFPIIQRWKNRPELKDVRMLVFEIMTAGVETYRAPLQDAESRITEFERNLFKSKTPEKKWGSVFRTKTRLTVVRSMLWHIQSVLQKLAPHSEQRQPVAQNLKEQVDSLMYLSQSLLDDLGNLLSVHISLASHRSSEVMRVLTLFSVVFMPLTFIVGVYGMNFHNMPELKAPYGYASVWGILILTAAVIFLWFRKRGWID